MIDWPRLLTQHGIEFVESGPSTSKNNLYVHCPMCGASDQGHHMGISTEGRGWGCWRNSNHRGRSDVKLLKVLLDISYERAAELIGGPKLESNASLKEKFTQIMSPVNYESSKKHKLILPPEILPLYNPRIKNKIRPIFAEYLSDRGYPEDIQPQISSTYKLHWALQGQWKYRLIFPIYTRSGLATWTGRHVTPGIEPRYDTLTVDPNKAYRDTYYSTTNIKDCLFNERWLFKREGGRALVVCEGPFDAMRIDYNGRKQEVYSTCLFGKTVSDMQLEKLYELGHYYNKCFVLLDPDAALDVFQLLQRIKPIGFTPLKLYGVNAEDPGALSNDEAKVFIRKAILNR